MEFRDFRPRCDGDMSKFKMLRFLGESITDDKRSSRHKPLSESFQVYFSEDPYAEKADENLIEFHKRTRTGHRYYTFQRMRNRPLLSYLRVKKLNGFRKQQD